MNYKKNPNILILLWHSQDAIAGGFVRVKEFLPHFKNFTIKIIDNSPSLIPQGKYSHISTIEYKLPIFIKSVYGNNYLLGRMLEWLHAFYSLVSLGRNELKKNNYDLIYGPTGDNLHIFMAGIILKWMFPSKKLLLDVLNLEMPEGNARNYFNNFRINKVNFFDAALRTCSLAFILFIEKLFIKSCDFVVTVSSYMKDIIAKYYSIQKIDFTPSGVSLPKNINFNNKKTSDGVYIGRHTKDKGIFDVISVWNKVYKKIPNTTLVTAGSCQEEIKLALSRSIKEDGLEKNVKILGMISEKEKWNLLSGSKFFLHLAYFEPLVPVITILEALAVGIPVIMYDQSALEDDSFLRKHSAVFIVKNKDKEAVVRAILHLSSLSKDELNVISGKAKKLAQQYGWKEIAGKEERIIRNLITASKTRKSLD